MTSDTHAQKFSIILFTQTKYYAHIFTKDARKKKNPNSLIRNQRRNFSLHAAITEVCTAKDADGPESGICDMIKIMILNIPIKI